MPVKLSQAAFCAFILESGLISQDRLRSLREKFEREHPGRESENCLALTEYLVRKNELTLWQAQKLVQGKHKGFFVGKYKLLSLLGRGGMSSVYLAEHTVMRRRCAIKILPFKQVKNAAALSRFYREAQAVAALDNPNIVRAYDVDKLTEGGNEIHFLVMEYADGRSLQQVVDEDGPLPIVEAVEYVRQAASGLAHAHSVGVVHRDVKPSNLLLDDSGTIKLLDLGLARIFEDASEQSSLTIEHQQTVLGTADYLSPEQAVDSHGVDHRSDLYSLGCTLYFLLTGHPPFPEGSLTQRLLAHQNQAPAPVGASRPEVPASLVAVIERMMAKRADARYQTAGELHQVLTQWLHNHAGETPQSTKRIKPTVAPATKALRTLQKSAESRSSGPAGAGSATPGDRRRRERRRQASTPVAAGSQKASEDDLAAFLKSLDASIEQEVNAPSISTSETIVSDTDIHRREPTSKEHAASSSHDQSAAATDESVSVETSDEHPSDPRASNILARLGRTVWKSPVPSWVRAAVLGGVLVVCVVIVAAWYWRNGGRAGGTASNGNGLQSQDSATASASAAPEIDPSEDIRVGPGGHFASIGAALHYVQATFHPLRPDDVRTIRVAGGYTYDERIVIDNSQSRSFPQGVRVICEDSEPAILRTAGTDPVVDLRTVERFRFKGFAIQGTGQVPLVRLEGYLVRTVLENLVLEGTGDVAILGVGATGFTGGNRLTLEGITFSNPHAASVAIRFQAGSTATKNVLIRRCRVLKGFAAGIRFEGGVDGAEVSECIFDGVAAAIEFDAAADPRENVLVANCTFRAFDRGILLGRSPSPSDGTFRFTKNLFAGADGPECLISGEPSSTGSVPPQFAASLNWTQRPAPPQPQPGEVDLFQQDGRRGAGFTFVSVDPDQPSTYLQPESSELREASALVPQPPQHIGAVAPAAE